MKEGQTKPECKSHVVSLLGSIHWFWSLPHDEISREDILPADQSPTLEAR